MKLRKKSDVNEITRCLWLNRCVFHPFLKVAIASVDWMEADNSIHHRATESVNVLETEFFQENNRHSLTINEVTKHATGTKCCSYVKKKDLLVKRYPKVPCCEAELDKTVMFRQAGCSQNNR